MHAASESSGGTRKTILGLLNSIDASSVVAVLHTVAAQTALEEEEVSEIRSDVADALAMIVARAKSENPKAMSVISELVGHYRAVAQQGGLKAIRKQRPKGNLLPKRKKSDAAVKPVLNASQDSIASDDAMSTPASTSSSVMTAIQSEGGERQKSKASGSSTPRLADIVSQWKKHMHTRATPYIATDELLAADFQPLSESAEELKRKFLVGPREGAEKSKLPLELFNRLVSVRSSLVRLALLSSDVRVIEFARRALETPGDNVEVALEVVELWNKDAEFKKAMSIEAHALLQVPNALWAASVSDAQVDFVMQFVAFLHNDNNTPGRMDPVLLREIARRFMRIVNVWLTGGGQNARLADRLLRLVRGDEKMTEFDSVLSVPENPDNKWAKKRSSALVVEVNQKLKRQKQLTDKEAKDILLKCELLRCMFAMEPKVTFPLSVMPDKLGKSYAEYNKIKAFMVAITDGDYQKSGSLFESLDQFLAARKFMGWVVLHTQHLLGDPRTQEIVQAMAEASTQLLSEPAEKSAKGVKGEALKSLQAERVERAKRLRLAGQKFAKGWQEYCALLTSVREKAGATADSHTQPSNTCQHLLYML